ncbi:reverse transcriptase domain-containing protein [Clostridium luticellarii]|uniref:reverse transcriptase domain-containing protein n=1 Tax=Clostridium luticellarii TaxID=1691940 RepID=UPI0030811E80
MVISAEKESEELIVPIIMQTIKLYIGKVGVMEDGEYKESKIGSPQGSPISPLLSNIYLNYFDVVWDKYYKHLGMLVKFADDFIIISRTKKEIYHAYNAVKKIFERLEL